MSLRPQKINFENEKDYIFALTEYYLDALEMDYYSSFKPNNKELQEIYNEIIDSGSLTRPPKIIFEEESDALNFKNKLVKENNFKQKEHIYKFGTMRCARKKKYKPPFFVDDF